MISDYISRLIKGFSILMFISLLGCSEDTNEIENPENGTVGSFIDTRDGKSYSTIQIGNQTWMAENLNYDTINGSWAFDNDLSNAAIYGRLYNWETAQIVCPPGWHLPSFDEWIELRNYLIDNGYNYDGSTLDNKISKSMASTSGWWDSRNRGSIGKGQQKNNTSGFNAHPCGYCSGSDHFGDKGNATHFWSSSVDAPDDLTWYWSLYFGRVDLMGSGTLDYVSGFSVRCVKD